MLPGYAGHANRARVRIHGQKLLLAVKNMRGESEAAWRAVLDDLIARGLRTPELLLIDGGAGLERVLTSLWPDVPAQRCTVHEHRNLLAHAPESMHEEVTADYSPPPQCILISPRNLVMFQTPEIKPKQFPHHSRRDRVHGR